MKEFYWKYIDIPQDDLNYIKEKYLKALPKNNLFFQTMNLGITHFLGMEVRVFVLIQVMPGFVSKPHTDYRPVNETLALQIPLINCEQCTTMMWHINSDSSLQLLHTPNGIPFNRYDQAECIEVTRFNLIKPVLWRTDIIHSVRNPTFAIRKAISIRFKQDPWHLLT
jgi:hypothetical protein